MIFPPAENLLLLGDQALSARWVRLCRHKAEDFARRLHGGETLSHKLQLPDGWAVIKVAKGRRKIIIYTESGHCFYEFFTSNLIDPEYFYTPPWDGDGVAFSVCGKGSYHRLGSGKTATPLVDLCTGCGDGDADDPGEVALPYSLKDCGSTVGLDDMQTTKYWNMVKAMQNIWYQDFKGDKFVIGGQDNVPYFKQHQMLTRYNTRRDLLPGGGYGWFLFSVGSQIPTAYTVDSFEPYAQGGFTPTAQQWGGALLRTTNFELICTVDRNNEWKFWETGDWSSVAPPKIETKTLGLNPVLISHGMQTVKFNNDGTRAMVVLTEFQQTVPYKSGGDVYKATQGQFQGLEYGSGNVDIGYGGSKALARDDMPWLEEIEITPFETGGGADWDVNVAFGSVSKRLRFSQGQDWVLAADYLGADYVHVDGQNETTYPADSIVIMTLEVVYDSVHGLTVGATPYWPDDANVYIQTAIKIKIWTGTGWDTIRTMVMSDNVHTYTSSSVALDQYGNPEAGWQTDMIPGNDGTGGYYLAIRSDTLNAINLKTLSWVKYRFYQTQPGATSNTRVGSSAIEVWHKNALAHRSEEIRAPHGSDTFTQDDPPFPRTNYLALPQAQVELWDASNWTVLQLLFRGQFAWHPKGHWAVCCPLTPIPPFQLASNFYMVDIVHAAGKSYSHKDLYNNAFGDNRDYTYYNDNDNYRGVFMTAGLFRDS